MGRTLIVASALLVLLAPALGQSEPGRTADGLPLSDAQPRREALERELRQILDQPDFKRAMRGSEEDPRAAMRRLLLRLQRLFARLGGLQQTNYGAFLVSVIVLSVLLIGLLAHITYTITRALRSAGRARGGPAPPPPARAKSADELRREAEALAARGEFREAIRSLYVALIRALQARGVLSRAASRTNWEYVRQLDTHPQVAAVLQPFTETFDAKWYGRRPASAEEMERCRAWFEAALREVETP
ncbi:MAG: DUF4129 domain-containing protein [Armatimonadetes bacterium]|nr:DUF4129 domain-containing protein [Armatimonadota bacterium]